MMRLCSNKQRGCIQTLKTRTSLEKAKRHSFRYIRCFALTIAVFRQHSHRNGAKRRGPQREYQICLEVCLEVRLNQMVETVTKVNETGETTSRELVRQASVVATLLHWTRIDSVHFHVVCYSNGYPDIDALHRSGASRNLGSSRGYVLPTTSSKGSRDKRPASAIFK